MVYKDLVLAHLHLGIAAWGRVYSLQRDMYRTDPLLVPGSPSSDIVEVFHSYVDQNQLDLVANLMEQKGMRDKDLIIEAWWTLIVRAIFHSCTLRFLPHAEFPPVASALHGSRTPVYIT
jgi:hypothetical protein